MKKRSNKTIPNPVGPRVFLKQVAKENLYNKLEREIKTETDRKEKEKQKMLLSGIEEYVSGMSPMTRGKTINILNKVKRYEGHIKASKDYISDLVKQGYHVKDNSMENGVYVIPFSKTEILYAKFLINKKPKFSLSMLKKSGKLSARKSKTAINISHKPILKSVEKPKVKQLKTTNKSVMENAYKDYSGRYTFIAERKNGEKVTCFEKNVKNVVTGIGRRGYMKENPIVKIGVYQKDDTVEYLKSFPEYKEPKTSSKPSEIYWMHGKKPDYAKTLAEKTKLAKFKSLSKPTARKSKSLPKMHGKAVTKEIKKISGKKPIDRTLAVDRWNKFEKGVHRKDGKDKFGRNLGPDRIKETIQKRVKNAEIKFNGTNIDIYSADPKDAYSAVLKAIEKDFEMQGQPNVRQIRNKIIFRGYTIAIHEQKGTFQPFTGEYKGYKYKVSVKPGRIEYYVNGVHRTGMDETFNINAVSKKYVEGMARVTINERLKTKTGQTEVIRKEPKTLNEINARIEEISKVLKPAFSANRKLTSYESGINKEANSLIKKRDAILSRKSIAEAKKKGTYSPKKQPVKEPEPKFTEPKIKAKYVYGSFQRPIWNGFDPGVKFKLLHTITDAHRDPRWNRKPHNVIVTEQPISADKIYSLQLTDILQGKKMTKKIKYVKSLNFLEENMKDSLVTQILKGVDDSVIDKYIEKGKKMAEREKEARSEPIHFPSNYPNEITVSVAQGKIDEAKQMYVNFIMKNNPKVRYDDQRIQTAFNKIVKNLITTFYKQAKTDYKNKRDLDSRISFRSGWFAQGKPRDNKMIEEAYKKFVTKKQVINRIEKPKTSNKKTKEQVIKEAHEDWNNQTKRLMLHKTPFTDKTLKACVNRHLKAEGLM